MAQQFGAQFEQTQAAAQHVATVNENVQAQLSRLYNQLEPLSRAWQGQAAIAFQILMQRWQADAGKLSEALTSIGERILESGATCAQNDGAEHQSYSPISQALRN
ncbi:MAG: WXG100 family type VII secretion target [Pseudonocardiales bacterium]|nr:WXG100 family type VII secretion target [Pseudonocardiales bacterium]